MDWEKLKVFRSVAEAGSFTRAGEVIGLSQSAVSRQVSSLERDLKVSLFHRHARGLILTEQGELLYRTAHEVFTKLEAAKTMLRDSKEKPSGILRVTTTVGLGSNWLTPRLTEFIELYPDINIQLMLQDTELDLGMREADVAIRLRKPVQAELIQRKLFTVHFHIYASPGYINEYGVPRSIEELDDHRIVSFGVMTPPYLKNINWLENQGLNGGKPREPVLSINSVDGIKRAAQNGIGIAALPDYIVRDESKAGLVRILTESETPSFDTYFVYAEESRNSQRMIVFRDFLLGKARQWSF